jgi:glycolate oxidase iron-sulfur subunit
VGVLRGCVQQGLFSRVGEATRRTLAANGYRVVDVADAGCCGALHAHAGGLDDAREAARRQVAAFEVAGVDRVAVDAAGCGAAMKGYGALLADDPAWRERAATFAARVSDVTELLAEAGPRRGGTVELTAAYDPPCHLLHGQGVDRPVQAVLEAVPGLDVRPVPQGDRCCGGAGIWGLTQGALADTIAQEKVAAVLSTGADVVLTGNPGCMMQIGGGLLLADADMGVVHPVELLDESYRRGGIYGPGPGSQGAGLP